MKELQEGGTMLVRKLKLHLQEEQRMRELYTFLLEKKTLNKSCETVPPPVAVQLSRETVPPPSGPPPHGRWPRWSTVRNQCVE